MINISTGEIKLDDYELIIHPDLTYEQFIAGNFRDIHPCDPDGMGYVRHFFQGHLDGNEASFGIRFRFGKIHALSWCFTATEKLTPEEAKRWINDWLNRTIGRLPPYEAEWGRMGISFDIKCGDTDIEVVYKDYVMVDLGFKDIESYHEYCNYPRNLRQK